jgi:hypothetical protein
MDNLDALVKEARGLLAEIDAALAALDEGSNDCFDVPEKMSRVANDAEENE